MSLETLDRTTPSFMRQGPSALSQIVLYIALALLLMLADVRWRITDPLRQVVSTVLYPVQWLMVQPLEVFSRGADYFMPYKPHRIRPTPRARGVAAVAACQPGARAATGERAAAQAA